MIPGNDTKPQAGRASVQIKQLLRSRTTVSTHHYAMVITCSGVCSKLLFRRTGDCLIVGFTIAWCYGLIRNLPKYTILKSFMQIICKNETPFYLLLILSKWGSSEEKTFSSGKMI